ncbi:MAG: AAA family ATPase [Candidatus Rokubacteria bacterium]|nr:AAA family ATPase [Candidatus Rokubacteria bacterium]
MGVPLISEVQIKNYKSLAQVVARLNRLTVLVGPNGSGKSNFADALRFVADSLTSTVSLALKQRGGIAAVRRISIGHPHNFGIRLKMDLSDSVFADFSFEIAAAKDGNFFVARERCVVNRDLREDVYELHNGEFTTQVPGIRAKIEPDRLALTILSAVEDFRPVFDFLSRMRFYSLVPDRIREIQDPDAGDLLRRDGSNAAAVLREIRRKAPDDYDRACRLLSKIVPGVSSVEYHSLGQKETLKFKQDVGSEYPWTFQALNMSDGTLRALGILLAIYQSSTPSLLVVEEPESTIHPAAIDVLVQVLKDGQHRTQVLVTTHSPDVLDNKAISDENIRAVENQRGRTVISVMGPVSRESLKQKLYTAGELMRSGELEPDRTQADALAEQLDLFGPVTKS